MTKGDTIMHSLHTISTTTISTAALLAGSLLVGCTTDDASSDGSGGAGPSSSGATAGQTATGGGSSATPGAGGESSSGTVCESKAAVAAAPIATFDNCTLGLTGTAATSGCTVSAIGGTTLFGGVFFYDDGTGNPVFSVVSGHAGSAIGLASTEPASNYGGGFGIWTTGCFNASAYKGITFWTRGIAPNSGKATMTVMLAETAPSVPPAGNDNRGTCTGTGDQCKPPKFSFPVTDSWTQVHAIWSGFTGGDANGTPVTVTGDNIFQFQWDIGLAFVPDASGTTYVAVPAAYELQIDDVAFE
jgi:hypothetical protein